MITPDLMYASTALDGNPGDLCRFLQQLDNEERVIQDEVKMRIVSNNNKLKTEATGWFAKTSGVITTLYGSIYGLLRWSDYSDACESHHRKPFDINPVRDSDGNLTRDIYGDVKMAFVDRSKPKFSDYLGKREVAQVVAAGLVSAVVITATDYHDSKHRLNDPDIVQNRATRLSVKVERIRDRKLDICPNGGRPRERSRRDELCQLTGAETFFQVTLSSYRNRLTVNYVHHFPEENS
ncbi:MAG: hypothetical protein ACI9S8_002233 [Chlamydiales bacterium]|jgi:hypothetical protein